MVPIRAGDEPGEPSSEGRITAALIGWERAAGRQMRISPASPDVRGWVAGRLTPAELRQAYDTAVETLKAKAGGFPLTAAYLGTVIARQRAEADAPARAIAAPKAAARAEWEADDRTMLAKAAELGLTVNDNWTAEDLRWHILQRIRQQVAA